MKTLLPFAGALFAGVVLTSALVFAACRAAGSSTRAELSLRVAGFVKSSGIT